jgi:glycosyltransferase involved in cell wall biosynthesis
VLGWLGRCSEEKGFSFFFEACRRFLITHPDTPCTILIQYLMSPEGCRITAAEVEQLAASDPRVLLVKEPASGSAFGHLLGELDCLVLPYLRRNYVGRNSSAALDAVLAGIPIITTEGTWMAELMEALGAGLACRDQDASDLAVCMKRAVDSCPTLTAEAWERSSLARENVSWTRFSALIFSPQGRASAGPSQSG